MWGFRSIARIDDVYYTPTHGHGHARHRASAVVGGDLGFAEIAGASVLREAERLARHRGVRPVRGDKMPAFLRARHGTTQRAAGSLLPVAADWLFRRPRLGTRHRVARDGL